MRTWEWWMATEKWEKGNKKWKREMENENEK